MHAVPPCFVAKQRTYGLDNGSNRCSYLISVHAQKGYWGFFFVFTNHEVSMIFLNVSSSMG